MSATKYINITGVIWGEATGNDRLDYLNDALGSLITTVDQVQSINSTFTYKPFGELLSGAGNYSNQPLRYFGTIGHLSSLVFPNQLQHGSNVYNVSFASALNFVDSNPERGGRNVAFSIEPGLITSCDLSKTQGRPVHYTTEEVIFRGNCGFWSGWTVKWNVEKTLSGLSGTSGYIIQEVQFHNVSYSKFCKEDVFEGNVCGNYWELWYVNSMGKIFIGDVDVTDFDNNDTWSWPTDYPCSEGNKNIDGYLKFYPVPRECSTVWDFKPRTDHECWGSTMLGGKGMPRGWSRTNSVHRMAYASWNCCPDPENGICIPNPDERDCKVRITKISPTPLEY